jgi:uncharacterized protein with GYD domain
MQTYVTLMKYTEQGVRDIKNTLRRYDETIKPRLEALGIELTDYYLVMGEFDDVVIWKAPSDEVAMTWLLELGAMGNSRSTTLRAFNAEQFSEMIEKLP